jgi:hypothetical protein
MASTATAAEQYADIKQQRFESWLSTTFTDAALKGVDLFEVKCPSGMAFKCRKLSREYMAQAGQIPMVLSSQVILAAGDEAPSEAESQARFARMTPQEKLASMRASAQMVRYVAVEPRLVLGAVNGHKNAISVDDLTMEDFAHLYKWAQGGGDAAEGLKTFRRKRK